MSGRGVIQEFGLITLNRPDLVVVYVKGAYLYRSDHEAHFLVGQTLNCACVKDDLPITSSTAKTVAVIGQKEVRNITGNG